MNGCNNSSVHNIEWSQNEATSKITETTVVSTVKAIFVLKFNWFPHPQEYGSRDNKGIHRTCEPENIVGDAEFRTTDGESFIKTRH